MQGLAAVSNPSNSSNTTNKTNSTEDAQSELLVNCTATPNFTASYKELCEPKADCPQQPANDFGNVPECDCKEICDKAIKDKNDKLEEENGE